MNVELLLSQSGQQTILRSEVLRHGIESETHVKATMDMFVSADTQWRQYETQLQSRRAELNGVKADCSRKERRHSEEIQERVAELKASIQRLEQQCSESRDLRGSLLSSFSNLVLLDHHTPLLPPLSCSPTPSYTKGHAVLQLHSSLSRITHFFYSRQYHILQCPSLILHSLTLDPFISTSKTPILSHSQLTLLSRPLQAVLAMWKGGLWERHEVERRVCAIAECVPSGMHKVDVVYCMEGSVDIECHLQMVQREMCEAFGIAEEHTRLYRVPYEDMCGGSAVEYSVVHGDRELCRVEYMTDFLSRCIGLRYYRDLPNKLKAYPHVVAVNLSI